MARPLKNVVFADGAAFAFPTVDGACLAPAELQPYASAAATALAYQDQPALLARDADTPLDVVTGKAKVRFEVDDGLHTDVRGPGELFHRPFDQCPGGATLGSRENCSFVRHAPDT